MTDIVVSNVTVEFGEGQLRSCVFRNLSFKLPGGRATALVGPSGCGKTTLLRVLAKLIEPSEGTVEIVHQGPPPVIGYMPQSQSLLPWRTALSNVLLGLELTGLKDEGIRARAQSMMGTVGLEDACNKLPAHLSGGMRRRVELARTLVLEPKILFLDEPLAHLDMLAQRSMAAVIRNYIVRTNSTAVIVTHSAEEAATIADRVIVLAGKPARISDEFTAQATANEDNGRSLAEAEIFARIMAALS